MASPAWLPPFLPLISISSLMEIHAPVLEKSGEAHQIPPTQIISSYHLNTREKTKVVNTKMKAKTSSVTDTIPSYKPVMT